MGLRLRLRDALDLTTPKARTLALARRDGGNFKGSKSNQLSFAKGDIILITQTEGNWYKGILQQSSEYSITGDAKFVPKNFLRDML